MIKISREAGVETRVFPYNEVEKPVEGPPTNLIPED